MSFAFPEAFLALFLLVPVVLVLRGSERRTRETAAVFKGRSPKRAFFVVRLVLACTFVAALTVIAARPYVAYKKSADFLFIVDVSRSMHARHSCSEPTFLGRAKKVVRETIVAIPGARVGIVAFDRFAFPITQLTSDRDYLGEVIDHGLYVGLMLEATQTEIANALAVVAAKKRRLPEIYGSVRHVIVLSDGHVSGSYGRRLRAPMAELLDAGIKVSTVGIGNPEETPIADTEAGRCVNRHVEVGGDKVMIPLRTDILKFIATETGGSYFSEKETDRLVETLRAELEQSKASDGGAAGPRRDVGFVVVAVATLALLGFMYMPARFPRA